MNKIISLSVASVLLLSAGTVSAQSYYGVSSGCTNITSNLSYGSRGAAVSELQRFLLSRNYPGSGSWMVTGYFGRATETAVRNFQNEQRVLASGWVDSNTRMAIDRVSCLSGQGGGTVGVYTSPNYVYQNPFNNSAPYTTPYVNQYPQPYISYNNTYGNPFNFNGTNYYGNVTLTSLSANTGYPGTSLTIYGSGFDVTNNTVYFGSTPVSAYTQNGTTLTVNVPTNVTGIVQVYVQNSRGTSNNLSFSVTTNYNNGYNYDNQYGCNGYNGSSGCCGYGSNCPLQISYLNPTSGGVGSTVTIVGTGFSTTGNTVHFGVGIITGLTSPDTRSVSFTIPTQLSGYGAQQIAIGQYPVSVTNSSGATSNTLSYNVTALGSSGAPTITSVSGPTTLSVNSSGVWTLTVNNQGATYTTARATWGDPVYGAYLAAPLQILGTGAQTVTFSHSYSQTGTFTINFTVINQSGQTNTSSVTVNVTNAGSTGNVSLSSLTPSAGHVGTQVVLTGSNFSALDNTVHFGQGGTLHVPSSNGTSIYYTIPYAVSTCDLIGYGCAAPTTLVSQGQYPVYVTNSNGTSGTLYFSVQ